MSNFVQTAGHGVFCTCMVHKIRCISWNSIGIKLKKTSNVYFIKQKLFGYSPSDDADILHLMIENIRKAFA